MYVYLYILVTLCTYSCIHEVCTLCEYVYKYIALYACCVYTYVCMYLYIL